MTEEEAKEKFDKEVKAMEIEGKKVAADTRLKSLEKSQKAVEKKAEADAVKDAVKDTEKKVEDASKKASDDAKAGAIEKAKD